MGLFDEYFSDIVDEFKGLRDDIVDEFGGLKRDVESSIDEVKTGVTKKVDGVKASAKRSVGVDGFTKGPPRQGYQGRRSPGSSTQGGQKIPVQDSRGDGAD